MSQGSKACVIRLDPPKVSGGRVRLDGHLEIPGKPDWDVHFDFTCPDPSQATIRARPFVLAFLPLAMRLGLPLRCEHPIDAVTRDNLRGWQTFQAGWSPLRLRRVNLELPVADERRARVGAGAITAFSGGVDSCFTAARHAGKPAGEGLGHRLAAGLMIHGFDIRPEDTAGFSRAMANTRELLAHYNLEPNEIVTNVRARHGRPKLCWERETYGIWLAASLACLEPWFDATVIPSSFPVQWSIVPTGSVFITDPLLGSGAAPCINDGHRLSKPNPRPQPSAWEASLA